MKKIALIGSILLVILGCVLAAGCTSTHAPSIEEDIIGTWMVKTDNQVTLILEKDGTYSGTAPVNLYGGTYSLRASETEPRGFLILGAPYSTKMAGSDDDMAAEDTYFQLLPQVVSYIMEDSELRLLDENENVLLTYIKG